MDVWIIFIIHCFYYVLSFLTYKRQLSATCLFFFTLQTVVLLHMRGNMCSLYPSNYQAKFNC